MNRFTANPFAYLFSLAALVFMVLYYGYVLVDRMGLATHNEAAIVTGKQSNPGGTSYYTNIVAGRAWAQSQPTPETFVVMLRLGGETTVALVDGDTFDSLHVNDSVTVTLRRTRITHRLEVVRMSR